MYIFWRSSKKKKSVHGAQSHVKFSKTLGGSAPHAQITSTDKEWLYAKSKSKS